MKYYSAVSLTVMVKRSLDYYPSIRRARRLAKHVAFVLECEDMTEDIARFLSGCLSGTDCCETLRHGLTAPEMQVLTDFSFWLGGEVPTRDSQYTADIKNVVRSFVLTNLNKGFVRVFVAAPKYYDEKRSLSLDFLTDEEANHETV